MNFEVDASLVGKRVRIRAIKQVGSARVLDGLTAIVTGIHPLAQGWYSIRLEENTITAYDDWTIPGDRLVAFEDYSR